MLEDSLAPEADVILHNPNTCIVATAHPKKIVLKGYWIVETTFTPQNYSIVRFYDSQDNPLYTERLADFLPNSSERTRRRAFRQLSAVLQHVLREPMTPASGTTLIAQQLKAGETRVVKRVVVE